MTTYYVTTSGSDSNAGTSEGTAFATLGKAGSVALTSGDIIYVKAGTYVLATDTCDVSGGCMVLRKGVQVYGYESTPGDNCPTDNRPLFDASGFTSFAGNVGLINWTNPFTSDDAVIVKNLHLLGVVYSDLTINPRPRAGFSGYGVWHPTAPTSNRGYNILIENCIIEGFQYGVEKNYLAQTAHTGKVHRSILRGCTRPAADFGIASDCYIEANIRSGGFWQCYNCVIEFIGDGAFGTWADGAVFAYDLTGCILINSGPSTTCHGAELAGNAYGNIAIGFNTGYRTDAEGGTGVFSKCYSYGETTLVNHVLTTPNLLDDFISLTQDPFVDSANLDFTLNQTSTANQELGTTTTDSNNVERALNWYRLPVDHGSEQDAYYPFRWAASGSFQTDVLQLHPLRENK